jgi:predicted ribonuclease YlaK
MKKTKFYDTCSLLLDVDNLFQKEENIVISSITLSELENIKTASNKDPDIKYSARKVVQKLNDHYGEYTIVIYNPDFWNYFENQNVPVGNDSNILACALAYQIAHSEEDFSFITNDLCLKHIARTFINNVESIEEDKIDDYPGYKDISLNDEELAEFYQTDPTEKNMFNMKVGEYLILRDKDNEIIDLRKWADGGYAFLVTNGFNSNWFGKVNPYKSDVYQKLLFDSLHTNQITMVKGPAGTGKSYISLAYLMTCLERGKIDKIIIFCNTVATANSARLGSIKG